MERKNAWQRYDQPELAALEKLSQDYRAFLDGGKTERECASLAVVAAKQAGYRPLADFVQAGQPLKAGDKIYLSVMDKAVALFNIGSRPLAEGLNILGAHIDSPRLDIKQNPLYEEGGQAYLDTHYYGGIKKYQWVAMPLAIHGVVAKKDGSLVNVVIGEDEADPAFCVTDLLIHLSKEQLEKKANKVVEGEDLDLLVGSRPLKDQDKDGVAAHVRQILKEQYGIEEEDFFSAEWELVPAGKAREAGFDRSMILAYGQDDRVCAFTSLWAMLDADQVARTACCLLVDKEEVGSVGATGARALFFENAVAELLALSGDSSLLTLRRCLAASRMLSSDVSAAFDPLYAASFEKKNAAFLGQGLVFNKYTGSGGKSGSSDANAEYLGFLRRVLEAAGVCYQSAELGKVDVGGGGTIAYVLALYGMDVVDSGVAVLSMHAPWEIASKADIYEAWKGYKAFLESVDQP